MTFSRTSARTGVAPLASHVAGATSFSDESPVRTPGTITDIVAVSPGQQAYTNAAMTQRVSDNYTCCPRQWADVASLTDWST
jgi:hypothetical protein